MTTQTATVEKTVVKPTQIQPAPDAQLPAKFEDQLEHYAPQFKAVLPSHIPLDRFKRVVITAINQNPDLAHADRRSLFNSCVKAAQDGLYPDGREAALVIFNTKVKGSDGKERWEKRVQYLPMVAGVRKRMRNSGAVDSAEAHVVYKNDNFDYELGDEPRIEHKPALEDRGAPIGAYAIIKLTNGEVLREYMSRAEIELAREVSRAKDNGPWVTWWGEMARKTVLRRCAKAAPMQADLDALLKRDDEIEPDDRPEAPPRPTRADFIEPPKQPELYDLVDEHGEIAAQLPSGDLSQVLIKAMSEPGADFHGIYERHAETIAEAAPFKDVREAYTALCEAEAAANKAKETPAAATAGATAGAGTEAATPAQEDAPRDGSKPASPAPAAQPAPELVILNASAKPDSKKRWLADMTAAVPQHDARAVHEWARGGAFENLVAACEKIAPQETAKLKRLIADRIAG